MDKANAMPRKKVLVESGFQIRFSFYVCSWIFALSVVYPLMILSLFDFFKELLKRTLDPALLQTTGLVSLIANTESQVFRLVILFHLLFLLIIFLISLFASHRIAGPVVKLSSYLKRAAKADFSQKLFFRRSDHFQFLSDDFNQLVDYFQKHPVRPDDKTFLEFLTQVREILPLLPEEKRQSLENSLKKL